MVRGFLAALLAAGLAFPSLAAAPAGDDEVAAAHGTAAAPALRPTGADFLEEAASPRTRQVADWVAVSRDNAGLPFIVIDKAEARVFLFDHQARLQGAVPALLGLGLGDDTVPGIGQRKLATITPAERTTPAGRFVASLGHDFEQDILWIDYESGLSLHRVISGHPNERRHQRLASPTPLDNRISYGCINVPVSFYDDLVIPAFTATVGIVYILPESGEVGAVFAMAEE